MRRCSSDDVAVTVALSANAHGVLRFYYCLKTLYENLKRKLPRKPSRWDDGVEIWSGFERFCRSGKEWA